MIYHLTNAEAWASARERGELAPSSLVSEGFVHLSSRAQLLESAEKHFASARELLVLAVDEAAPGLPALRWEDTSGAGQRFPHIYGPIAVGAVRAAVRLGRGADGRFGPLPLELP